VVEDETSKTIYCYWCSCKWNADLQNAKNSMAHVVSFFNNRGCEKHYLWNYKRVFGFFSPLIREDQRKKLSEQMKEVDTILAGSRVEVIEECTRQLSNVHEHGKKFAASAELLAQNTLFKLDSHICADLNDMIKVAFVAD
jgi:hypothetical protein